MEKKYTFTLAKSLFFALGLTIAGPSEVVAEGDDADMQALIRKTLLENPEIIQEALQILQERQVLEQQRQQAAALETAREALMSGDLTPVGGNPNGDVVLIEFFDYQCGFCKRAFPSVKDALAQDGQVKMIYKEFAILGPQSVKAARAALAAHKQGQYHAFHDQLMQMRGRLSERKIMDLAQSLNLDLERLRQDMDSQEITDELQRTRDLAQQLNITGTPGFIIGDIIVPGVLPTKDLLAAIQQARRDKAKKEAG